MNAQQYLWRYEYTGLKGAKWPTYSYNDLVLPAGVTVMLDFTSSDAEAAWWVPQLGGSITAMPGYANKVWIRADKAGLYTGSGTVVNGTNYASQTTNVSVVDPRFFVRWLAGKQLEITRGPMAALGRRARLMAKKQHANHRAKEPNKVSTTAFEQPEQVSEVVVREPIDNTRATWINRARSADHKVIGTDADRLLADQRRARRLHRAAQPDPARRQQTTPSSAPSASTACTRFPTPATSTSSHFRSSPESPPTYCRCRSALAAALSRGFQRSAPG